MVAAKRTLYDIVGVPPGVPREFIAAACRRRLAVLERETGEAARAEILVVRDAWAILGDQKLRAAYDASLSAPAAPAPPDAAPDRPALEREIAPASLASELTRPRHLWAENWERYRKLVYAMLIVGLFAISAVYNHSRRVAHDIRLEAANYEAEHGEPPPHLRKPEPPPAKAPEEPFSAEKFEQEMKAREAEIREREEQAQLAQEEEFRRKLAREGGSPQSRRRARER